MSRSNFWYRIFPLFMKKITENICWSAHTHAQCIIRSCSPFNPPPFLCLSVCVCSCMSVWIAAYRQFYTWYTRFICRIFFFFNETLLWSALGIFNFYHNIKSKIRLLSYSFMSVLCETTFNFIVRINASVDRFYFELYFFSWIFKSYLLFFDVGRIFRHFHIKHDE